jgi:hypothetical protein
LGRIKNPLRPFFNELKYEWKDRRHLLGKCELTGNLPHIGQPVPEMAINQAVRCRRADEGLQPSPILPAIFLCRKPGDGYNAAMTKLLEKALETVRQLPPADQDEIARAMLSLAGDEEPEDIDPAHLPDVLEGLAQARRRQFASDAEVEAAFRRFDP